MMCAHDPFPGSVATSMRGSTCARVLYVPVTGPAGGSSGPARAAAPMATTPPESAIQPRFEIFMASFLFQWRGVGTGSRAGPASRIVLGDYDCRRSLPLNARLLRIHQREGRVAHANKS